LKKLLNIASNTTIADRVGRKPHRETRFLHKGTKVTKDPPKHADVFVYVGSGWKFQTVGALCTASIEHISMLSEGVAGTKGTAGVFGPGSRGGRLARVLLEQDRTREGRGPTDLLVEV
jgi:hypothetical protein